MSLIDRLKNTFRVKKSEETCDHDWFIDDDVFDMHGLPRYLPEHDALLVVVGEHGTYRCEHCDETYNTRYAPEEVSEAHPPDAKLLRIEAEVVEEGALTYNATPIEETYSQIKQEEEE